MYKEYNKEHAYKRAWELKAEGLSANKAAIAMNDEGFKNAHGKPLTRAYVYDMWRRPSEKIKSTIIEAGEPRKKRMYRRKINSKMETIVVPQSSTKYAVIIVDSNNLKNVLNEVFA